MKKKEDALRNSEKTSMTSAQVKFREQRDLILYLFRKQTKLKYREIENLLLDYDIEMSFQQIQKICAKFGDKGEVKEQRKEESVETEDIGWKINEEEGKSDKNGVFGE